MDAALGLADTVVRCRTPHPLATPAVVNARTHYPYVRAGRTASVYGP